MPDLMSHLLIGLILAEMLNVKKKSIVVLGALVPDILAKIHLAYFYVGIEQPLTFVHFHTPLMAFLLSVVIAPLFQYKMFTTILYFNMGSISHFLADFPIKHFTEVGTIFFFPFSTKGYTLNWVWPEQSIYIFITTLLVYLLIKAVKAKNL